MYEERRSLFVLGLVLIAVAVLSAGGCQKADQSCSDDDECFKGEYCTEEGVCALGDRADADPMDADGGTDIDAGDGGEADIHDGSLADTDATDTDATDATDAVDAEDAEDCLTRSDGGCGCLYEGKSDGVCGEAVRSPETGACQKPEGFESDEESCDQRDNDCDGEVDEGLEKTFYLDEDQDGYGAATKEVEACEDSSGPMSGLTTNSEDCDDSDIDAHPNQTNFFDHPRNGGGYDYDCDGKALKKWTQSNSCDDGGHGGNGEVCGRASAEPDGWDSGRAPDCGATADWITDCKYQSSSDTCRAVDEKRQQKCR